MRYVFAICIKLLSPDFLQMLLAHWNFTIILWHVPIYERNGWQISLLCVRIGSVVSELIEIHIH